MNPLETRLRPPEDGLQPTPMSRSWLGKRWIAAMEGRPAANADRRNRASALVRAGRVRALQLSPSLVTAEVIDTERIDVSLHFPHFSEDQWRRWDDVVLSDLSLLGDFLEGVFTERLFLALVAAGLPMLPTWKSVEGSCSCSDFASPCAHQVAVYSLLADVLEGDAVMLTTLLGLTRQSIVARIQKRLGDLNPVEQWPKPVGVPSEADANWIHANPSLPVFSFAFGDAKRADTLLLKDTPGHPLYELLHSLEPLYDVGRRAARELALQEAQPIPIAASVEEATSPQPEEITMDTDNENQENGNEVRNLTAKGAEIVEGLINLLAATPGMAGAELAKELNVDKQALRREMIVLEELGMVYRTGNTRNTQWWLG